VSPRPTLELFSLPSTICTCYTCYTCHLLHLLADEVTHSLTPLTCSFLEVLKWLREQDCPWDAATCAYAARGGHLEVLKWAREHGCPWQEDIVDSNRDCCALASQGGHLEVLKWLRGQNCP
jgi:hypothetical protein